MSESVSEKKRLLKSRFQEYRGVLSKGRHPSCDEQPQCTIRWKEFIPNGIHVALTSRTNESLVKSVFVQQFQLINDQSNALEKHKTQLHNLKQRNKELQQELDSLRVEMVKNMKPIRIAADRSSTQFKPSPGEFRKPFLSFVPLHSYSQEKEKRNTGLTRERRNSKDIITDVDQTSPDTLQAEDNPKPSSSDASTIPVRKTRSSTGPADLAPFVDFCNKRRSKLQMKDKNVLQVQGIKSPSINPPATKLRARKRKRLPRLNFDLDKNYITTTDSGFLPVSLFQEIEKLEYMDVEVMGNIEVPSWRRNKVLPSQRWVSGIECLDDLTFQRRHWRCEENEKRRKRWDAQKTRQDLYVEQLRERAKSRKKQGKNGNRHLVEDGWKDCPWIEPFHPNPLNAEAIEIRRDIPINVFGCVLSTFTKEDFKLPWQPRQHRRCSIQSTSNQSSPSISWHKLYVDIKSQHEHGKDQI